MWNWCYHYQYIIFALPLCLNPVISWLLSRKHDHRVPVADSWVFSSDPLTRADSSSPRLLRTLVWEHWLQSLHRCIPHWELSLGTRNCLPKVTPLLGDKPWPMMSWLGIQKPQDLCLNWGITEKPSELKALHEANWILSRNCIWGQFLPSSFPCPSPPPSPSLFPPPSSSLSFYFSSSSSSSPPHYLSASLLPPPSSPILPSSPHHFFLIGQLFLPNTTP